MNLKVLEEYKNFDPTGKIPSNMGMKFQATPPLISTGPFFILFTPTSNIGSNT